MSKTKNERPIYNISPIDTESRYQIDQFLRFYGLKTRDASIAISGKEILYFLEIDKGGKATFKESLGTILKREFHMKNLYLNGVQV